MVPILAFIVPNGARRCSVNQSESRPKRSNISTTRCSCTDLLFLEDHQKRIGASVIGRLSKDGSSHFKVSLSILTIRAYSRASACLSGVTPSRSAIVTSAPASTNARTVSV